RYW
ncbi:hypothetical protein KKC1_32000, partial [Calderihabitans maritimus]